MLTACGIETTDITMKINCTQLVATVLTACGIETGEFFVNVTEDSYKLQQCLPLAVLKLDLYSIAVIPASPVATVLTACGIETFVGFEFNCSTFRLLQQCLPLAVLKPWNCYAIDSEVACCNSAYRLRY